MNLFFGNPHRVKERPVWRAFWSFGHVATGQFRLVETGVCHRSILRCHWSATGITATGHWHKSLGRDRQTRALGQAARRTRRPLVQPALRRLRPAQISRPRPEPNRGKPAGRGIGAGRGARENKRFAVIVVPARNVWPAKLNITVLLASETTPGTCPTCVAEVIVCAQPVEGGGSKGQVLQERHHDGRLLHVDRKILRGVPRWARRRGHQVRVAIGYFDGGGNPIEPSVRRGFGRKQVVDRDGVAQHCYRHSRSRRKQRYRQQCQR